jgi:hypothetical protein
MRYTIQTMIRKIITTATISHQLTDGVLSLLVDVGLVEVDGTVAAVSSRGSSRRLGGYCGRHSGLAAGERWQPYRSR